MGFPIGPRCQRNTRSEIVIQSTFKPETNTNEGAVAVVANRASAVALENTVASYPHVPDPAEPAKRIFQTGQTPLMLLIGGRVVGQRGLNVGILRVELVDGVF